MKKNDMKIDRIVFPRVGPSIFQDDTMPVDVYASYL